MHDYDLQRVTAPANEPLSLAEVKLFLRIQHSDEDALLGQLVTAVREIAEQYLRQSLLTQRWKIAVHCASEYSVTLPMGPLQAIEYAAIMQGDEEIELSAEDYRLNVTAGVVQLDGELISENIIFEYSTGYGDDPADVPASIRQGMLQHLAVLYDARGAAEMPHMTKMLYGTYREVRL